MPSGRPTLVRGRRCFKPQLQMTRDIYQKNEYGFNQWDEIETMVKEDRDSLNISFDLLRSSANFMDILQLMGEIERERRW